MSNVTTNNKLVETQSNNEVKPQSKEKETWIIYSPTIQEYQKLYAQIDPERKLTMPLLAADEARDAHAKLVQENYTRKISAIYVIRTDDDRLWLNWHEVREGKSRMQRKKEVDVNNMGIKKVPIPQEDIVFDQENEEYNTVITGEKENRDELFVEFSASRLAELLEDINPYKTQFMIAHQGQRTFNVTKQEIQTVGKDFAKLYESKLNPSAKK